MSGHPSSHPTLTWSGKGSRRVVVAMSGGVDSSVALALLVRQGYDAVGVMAHFWAEPSCDGTTTPNKCCSPESEAIARQVCQRMGVPFYTIDLAEPFRRAVVEPFIADYLRGRTPNPCLNCNRDVKFGLLLNYALAQGADYLATGHYVRIRREGDTFLLLRGVDARKDQSYVLHMLGQRELCHALFPLGELTKAQVRALARELGLASADRPESQEICFVRDNDYRRFLADVAADAIRPGPIYNTAGERIGTHKGLPYYTIGQREGLGIAHTEPLYVIAIRPEDNALVAGTARELGRDTLTASRVSFVAGRPPPLPAPITAKIRYRAKEAPATLTRVEGDRAWVTFAAPLRDITPGQGVVFYNDEVVLGGGIIEA
ncbi:MAG: tRNA 2-thiouridine(34) synthase MnmA [Anaerolineales bacterium]